MLRPYRLYSRAAALMFVLVTVYTVPTKFADGRLGEDWLHSVLHLGSAALGGYAGWWSGSTTPARAYTWAVGVGYLALVGYGAFASGLFMGTRFAIPLGPAENVFHVVLSLPALAIGAAVEARARRR